MGFSLYGGYSSVAERQTVALDVEGSTPSTHPKFFISSPRSCSLLPAMEGASPLLEEGPYKRMVPPLWLRITWKLSGFISLDIDAISNRSQQMIRVSFFFNRLVKQ